MKSVTIPMLLALSSLLNACHSNPSLPNPVPLPSPAPMPQQQIIGGYSSVDVNDPEVQDAAQFAVQALGGLLNRVTKAERQVVAGMNYRLQLDLQNGLGYEVVVYVDLQQHKQLTSSHRLKASSIH